MRLCRLCGGKVPKGLNYPLVTCRECEKRAVNVHGRPPGGVGHRYFAGEAEVAGPGVPIDATSPRIFDRQQVPWFTTRVPLRNIRRYPRRGNAVETLTRLSFARNTTLDPKYIGLPLRLGVRRLTPADLLRIRESVGLSPWEQKRSI